MRKKALVTYSVDYECPDCKETVEIKFVYMGGDYYLMRDCPNCGFPIYLSDNLKKRINSLYERARKLLDKKDFRQVL